MADFFKEGSYRPLILALAAILIVMGLTVAFIMRGSGD